MHFGALICKHLCIDNGRGVDLGQYPSTISEDIWASRAGYSSRDDANVAWIRSATTKEDGMSHAHGSEASRKAMKGVL